MGRRRYRKLPDVIHLPTFPSQPTQDTRFYTHDGRRIHGDVTVSDPGRPPILAILIGAATLVAVALALLFGRSAPPPTIPEVAAPTADWIILVAVAALVYVAGRLLDALSVAAERGAEFAAAALRAAGWGLAAGGLALVIVRVA